MVIARLLPLLLVLLLGCLPPWPMGESDPGWPEDGDDDDGSDDDDDDDDDVGDDDDAGDDDDIQPDDDDAGPVDADEDGWPEDEDCDDEDPEVHPGAEELPCDGLDNDCDGNSGCQPCEQGSPQEMGAIPFGQEMHPGALAKGDQVHGMAEDRYFDLLRFSASLTGFHNFDLVSEELDSYLAIYDAGCTQLAADDNSGGGQNASITGLWLGIGDVILVLVSSADEREVGAYQLYYESWGL